jgi:mycothiol synthase
MTLTMRKFRGEDDYWRIRAFLREVFLLNDRHSQSWHVACFDYWRWHLIENCEVCAPMPGVTTVWEAPDGDIAAVLHPETRGEAILQVHPRWRTPDLEAEMLDYAEQHLSVPGKPFYTYALATDKSRQRLLANRGYTRSGRPEYQWRRWLDAPVPEVPVPAGYTVRPIGDVDELPGRSWASWRAFHPDEPDDAYEGWEWCLNLQRAPLYRRDLDIVAVAPDGTIAGYGILWYDDVTRAGLFDPVAVMPEHQRRGLGRAILSEAMRRAQRMGALLAMVGGYTEAANGLYSSTLSPEYDLNQPWMKQM